jgi:hypothetical protein
MYVTGLLMFYAGQIARKLVNDLRHSQEFVVNGSPFVNVRFAGKGSRLFQWLGAVNDSVREQYYNELFMMGYGNEPVNGRIDFPREDENIKFEVSKGLASGGVRGDLHKPTIEQPSEIIGETGFMLVGSEGPQPIEFINSISPEMMKQIGFNFCTRREMPQAEMFTKFCDYYYYAVSNICGWQTNTHELVNACQNMDIVQYAQNLPEFRQAQNAKSFDFCAPIIILEGMKFYDQTLIKLLKQ